MSNWPEQTQDSQARWERNAACWDDYMGDNSNSFHNFIIRPATEKLLNVQKGHRVLDIACGNGNFSRRLADLGARVCAFDFSPTMIERAKRRSTAYGEQINYKVVDATDYDALISLGRKQYDAAVANMALMDMADIQPLVQALAQLLKPKGSFVFSLSHPCFQTPGMRKIYEQEEINDQIVARRWLSTSRYIKSENYQGLSIPGQPVATRYFHRSLSQLMQIFFKHGFVVTGLEEPVFMENEKNNKRFEWIEIPPALIARVSLCQ